MYLSEDDAFYDDSYYYEEDYSEPNYEVTYADPGFEIDIPQLIEALDEPNSNENETIPEICPDDNHIAFSNSINQSREFISQNLGIHPSNLRQHHVPGLIVLRLEDFCIIRNESRNNRTVPHIIVSPPDDEFIQNHPDFAACFSTLYPQ